MIDDDDDLFEMTDEPFEWDLLLDDDELEKDRKRVSDHRAGATADAQKGKSGKKCHRGLFGGLFG